ncbi:MAG: hypothetical protein AAF555_10295 [Verrucomicrobiota bacterium]
MKTRLLSRMTAAILLVGFFANCTTTSYDAYGRPKQTVDPAVAVVGLIAAGAIGYAIASDNNDHKSYRRGRGHGGYHQSYHDGGYYCPKTGRYLYY